MFFLQFSVDLLCTLYIMGLNKQKERENDMKNIEIKKPVKFIKINAQILDGNMGEGWTDNHNAAIALAEITEQTWTKDLQDYAKDFNIQIDIDVDAGIGEERPISIDAEGIDYETYCDIESCLTDPNIIWDDYCGSLLAGLLTKE